MANQEFDAERDVPLLTAFGVAVVIAFIGVISHAKYTPLDRTWGLFHFALLLWPLLTCPILTYLGWRYNRLGWAWGYLAVAGIVCGGAVFAFDYNGKSDTGEMAERLATVQEKWTMPTRSSRMYALWVTFEDEDHRKAYKVTTYRGLWEKCAPGDMVCVECYPGKLGIAWYDKVLGLDDTD